ncbi:succinate dehydrogenase iron-sulfur subunit [Archaeoglobales archaeon]|nr:MAG: succinate dehydrogenase iron-sulfur subunit [Archaeoglobales archaeon]
MNLKFRILRYDPEEKRRYNQEYAVPFRKNMTILDALLYIKENLDHSLSFRYACQAGLCGSCGMIINGKENLACQTKIEEVGKIIELKPLHNFPVIKDLVVDFEAMFAKHSSIRPYIWREQEKFDSEYLQTPEELERFIMVASCINCGLCYSSCPVTGTDKLYLGPHALAQCYRYIMDTRDKDKKKRLDIIDSPHGIWRCHFAGECSEVCPKGVDPAYSIQQLKGFALLRRNELKRISVAPLKKEKRKFE